MADDPFAAIAEPESAPGGADPFASIAEPGDQFAANAASVAEQNSKAQPQTSGFFKQLMSPYNTAAAEFGEKHPVLGIPVRTAAAAAGALAQTGPAVYHAFADAPTEEEKKKFGEEETQGLKRVGLGLHRLVVDPVASAAADYKSGKVTPSAALSVLPEAIGVGIGSQAASEIGARGLSKVGELRTTMKEGVQPFARKATQTETALKDAVTDAAEKQGTALEKNKAERVSTVKENLEKQRAANTKIDQERQAVQEKNKGIELKNKTAADEVAKRETAAKLVDQQSVKLGEHIGEVEKSVAKEANAKFDAVREKVGNPETSVAPLVDAVKNVETNILQGIPENIKEFRSILGHGEDVPEGLRAAFEEATGELPEGPEPITWDKLQSLKSRIDARLRKGRMNGDLKRGLYSVQDTIVNTMGDIAEAKGAHDIWQDARNTWRQYKEDFHEPSGPSGSGSPVASALNAVDPKNIRGPFLGPARSTIGNRALDILRKYPQHGGNEAAALAEQMLQDHDTMNSLPKKAEAKPLAEPKQAHQMPESKPAPAIPEAPTVDAQKVAREAIAKKAANWGSFNARDIGILGSSVLAGTIMHLLGSRGLELPAAALSYEGMKYGASRLLSNPSVVEWLSKTPPEEAAVLAKIPGADKVKIINGLTQQAIKSGKPVKLSPAAQQLIGPANVARIAAATGSVSGTRVQNRKDALDLLNSQP